MSTHYETLQHADTYREAFAVEPPAALGERHLWPRKPGFFIVHAATATALAQGPASTVSAVEEAAPATASDTPSDAASTRAPVPAQWGSVPH